VVYELDAPDGGTLSQNTVSPFETSCDVLEPRERLAPAVVQTVPSLSKTEPKRPTPRKSRLPRVIQLQNLSQIPEPIVAVELGPLAIEPIATVRAIEQKNLPFTIADSLSDLYAGLQGQWITRKKQMTDTAAVRQPTPHRHDDGKKSSTSDMGHSSELLRQKADALTQSLSLTLRDLKDWGDR